MKIEDKDKVKDVLNEKLKEIKWIDSFILKWIYEGKDINIIKSEIEERKISIYDLKYFCKVNNLEFKNYYTDRLSASLPGVSMAEAYRDL